MYKNGLMPCLPRHEGSFGPSLDDSLRQSYMLVLLVAGRITKVHGPDRTLFGWVASVCLPGLEHSVGLLFLL